MNKIMAESSINIPYIQNYSKEFARTICDKFFQGKNTVSGKEILEITDLRQINLMIIKDLYDAWQNEIDSMRGPYFDYSSESVQEALNNLRNALSNNIKIERNEFEHLLSDAVLQTLVLIYSPYEFFVSLLSSLNIENLKTDQLKQWRKYIKINTHLYDSFLTLLDGKKISEAKKEIFIETFNEACSNMSEPPEDADQFLILLNNTLPIEAHSIYLEKENVVRQNMTSESNPALTESGEKKILHDEFKAAKTDTIADFLKRKSIESIRKSITINQKFMFVKELFNADEDFFTNSINDLDSLRNLTDAENYIETNFFNKNLWQRESEVVIEFLEVLQKKFS